MKSYIICVKEAAAALILENQVCHLYHKWWQVFFFYETDNVCIHISLRRTVPLFRFVKHLLAQMSAAYSSFYRAGKPIHANARDICLSFFF